MRDANERALERGGREERGGIARERERGSCNRTNIRNRMRESRRAGLARHESVEFVRTLVEDVSRARPVRVCACVDRARYANTVRTRCGSAHAPTHPLSLSSLSSVHSLAPSMDMVSS